jgi:large subunit ribosomal protein L15
MKIKKRQKASRMHGHGRGSNGRGERKRGRKKGDRGGKGMAGTGKRADQKKTLITKLYGHSYFGKQGITSKKTERDKRKRINLGEIQTNLGRYAKKTQRGFEVELKEYKILGTGEIKEKLIIHAKEASESAILKVKEKGGEIILPNRKENKEEKIIN